MRGGYAKIYHSILTDTKILKLSLADVGALTLLITWASREESDGNFVPDDAALTIRQRAFRKSVERLQEVGIVSLAGGQAVISTSSAGRQMVITNYLKYNTPKTVIEEKRALDRERKQAQADSVSARKVLGPKTENKDQRTKNKDLKGKPTKAPKGATTRCPEDFKPRPQDASRARDAGIDVDELIQELIDWSKAEPRKGRKADWDATFRTWARRRAKEIREKASLEDRKDKRYQGNSNNLTEQDRQYMARKEKEAQEREAEREQNERWRKESAERRRERGEE